MAEIKKKMKDLTDEEKKIIIGIIKKYPPINYVKTMQISKNPEYSNVIEEMKLMLYKKDKIDKIVKDEMNDYNSPLSNFSKSKKYKSLSLSQTKNKIKFNSLDLKKNKLVYSPNIYLNDSEYNRYNDLYKQYISHRSKSITDTLITYEDILKFKTQDILNILDKYFYSGNIIKILSILDNRFIDYVDKYDKDRLLLENYTCGSIHFNIFLYNFLNLIDIKCLYICYHNGKNYLSPLNNKNFKDFIQLKENLTYDNMLNDDIIKTKYYNAIKEALDNVYQKFQKVFTTKLEIPCSIFDIVIKHNVFNFDIEFDDLIEVKLLELTNNDYKTSIISNNSHVLSILKCNNKILFNPAFNTGTINNNYRIYDYIPLKNNFYELDKDSFTGIYHSLKKIEISSDIDIKTLYNSQFFNGKSSSIYAFTGDNLHFFSNRHNLLKKKAYIGGKINIDCPPLYIQDNDKGFCWYLSIISSLFYSDDISIILLNKSIRYIYKNIDKITNYNLLINELKLKKRIDYSKYDIDLKIIINFIIYTNIFLYTSYATIIKNKTENITNKNKWNISLSFLLNNEKIIKNLINLLLTYTNFTSNKILNSI
jgi:hypothetical protein